MSRFVDRRAGIEAATDAVRAVIGSLQDLATNTHEAREFYSDPIKPSAYDEPLQARVREIAEERKAAASRNRAGRWTLPR